MRMERMIHVCSLLALHLGDALALANARLGKEATRIMRTSCPHLTLDSFDFLLTKAQFAYSPDRSPQSHSKHTELHSGNFRDVAGAAVFSPPSPSGFRLCYKMSYLR